MASRSSNSNNSNSRGGVSSKSTPAKKRQSQAAGRSKKKGNIHLGKCVFLAIFALIFAVWARNDFQVQDTIDDFRNLTFLDLIFGDGYPTITYSEDFYEKVDYLALLYPEGHDVYYLDVMTISADDWEYEKMIFGGHDQLDRTLPIIAFLSERNLGRSESRGQQSHQPSGWQQNRHEVDGSEVWVKNRGHLIAYTLSFNFNADGEFSYGYLGSDDDPVNLFTQTAHSNQNVMTFYEGQIRDALASGSEVVFKAAPIFREDELMARGIWLQAVSVCENLLFSVYIFNEQPGVIIDHATGENWVYQ